eukprot:TRINITY_DN2297_c0_g1_i10.p1 TRINITY_DN2297_c0_g1~~TRINITY_DN2297_c0_g1_i10.p1  ORF type:complete len:831 (-),score=138.96 TRINITY_DN2297_c0_g1_i10:1339-3684(-)
MGFKMLLVLLFVNLVSVEGIGSKLFDDSLCGCEDATPLGGFSCEEQALYGKCSAEWMISGGYCLNTCDRCFCVGECICVDIPADENFTCAQQKEFNQCDADWMIDNRYCEFTCGRCPCLLESSGACMQYALNDLPEAASMLEIINGSSILLDLLAQAATGASTYLIPSNAAWRSFQDSIPNPDLLFDNAGLLAEFIGYHIITGSAQNATGLAQVNEVQTSHLGEPVAFEPLGRRNAKVIANGREANIVRRDIDRCGSFIHILDNVLVPAQTSLPSDCLQFALGSTEDTLGMLELIIANPTLQELLGTVSDEPRTYFIPSTQAWEEFRESLHMPELLFDEAELLAEFVALHVLVEAGELGDVEGEAESMHLGEVLVVDSSSDTVQVDGGSVANIVRKNIRACNSFINVIDKVLLPTTTSLPFECLQQALGARSETASLINLASVSNILTTALRFAAQSPHTYFVPSADAWLSLLNGMETPSALVESDELLAEVVSYHISRDSYDINDLLVFGNATTNHLGEMLTITTSDGPDAILRDSNGREAMVVTPDLKVCNSTVNVIDRVLLPSLTNVPYDCLLFSLETLPGAGEFSKLIYSAPELLSFLQDIASIPHTYLIPSNSAMEEFNALLLDPSSLLSNIVALEELIRFHIVEQNLNTQQLFEAGDIETLLFEEPIEFEFTSDFKISRRQPLDRTSAIIMPNIEVCNTTVHLIDHVLYPAITSIQELLDSERGVFRGLVEIPNEPLVTFMNLNELGESYLGEEDDALEAGESPLPESVLEIVDI